MTFFAFFPMEDCSKMTWNAAFIAFLASPLTLWLIHRFLLRNKAHWLLLWPIAVVACYVFLLLGVHLLDAHLLAELYKHDLNGDGSFSGSEDSPAMYELHSTWIDFACLLAYAIFPR
jgi:predicted PurR-regulated permease PerM